MYLYIVHVNIDTSHLICINPDVLEILQTSELNTEIKVKKYIRKERCDQNTINSLIYPNSSSFISVEVGRHLSPETAIVGGAPQSPGTRNDGSEV